MSRAVSRRAALRTAGVIGAGAVLGACTSEADSARTKPPTTPPTTSPSATTPPPAMQTRRPAGIPAVEADPLPALSASAFDLPPSAGAAELRTVLAAWQESADTLQRDQQRTVTVGIGPSLVDRIRELGYPHSLIALPAFRGDALEPARTGGDLLVSVTATSQDGARTGLATMAAAARSLRQRWQQNATHDPVRSGSMGRNALGFRDGSANPSAADPDFDSVVYVDEGNPAWLAGGTFLVVRRMRLRLAEFEALPVAEQERIIGRRKTDGAPLTGGTERTALDLTTRGRDGSFVLDPHAHARLTHPSLNMGARLVRRSYNYADADGTRGMWFQAYVRDPVWQFIPMQHRIADSDLLSRFATATGGGLWAIPRLESLHTVV